VCKFGALPGESITKIYEKLVIIVLSTDHKIKRKSGEI
jgi:hypothetical protein